MKLGRRPSEAALVLVDDVNGPMTRSDRLGTLEEAKAIELRCLGARPTGQRVLAA
jgi:hypothetical protein